MPRSDDRLYDLTRDLVTSMGYALVTVEDSVEGGRRILRFIIDHPRGITLGDCETASREIGYLLESDPGVEGRYSLEVSSPGLDRELSSEREYAHFAGRDARFVLREPRDGQAVLLATVLGAVPGGVRVRLANGEETVLPFRSISRARLTDRSSTDTDSDGKQAPRAR